MIRSYGGRDIDFKARGTRESTEWRLRKREGRSRTEDGTFSFFKVREKEKKQVYSLSVVITTLSPHVHHSCTTLTTASPHFFCCSPAPICLLKTMPGKGGIMDETVSNFTPFFQKNFFFSFFFFFFLLFFPLIFFFSIFSLLLFFLSYFLLFTFFSTEGSNGPVDYQVDCIR